MEFETLKQWIKERAKIEQIKDIALIYRGSRDGFEASTFHQRCDEHSQTLTIVKADTGKRFGGFTALAWDQSNDWKGNDETAFLFSIENNELFGVND